MKQETKDFLKNLKKDNFRNYGIMVGQAINLAINNAQDFDLVIDAVVEYTKKAEDATKEEVTKEEQPKIPVF